MKKSTPWGITIILLILIYIISGHFSYDVQTFIGYVFPPLLLFLLFMYVPLKDANL